MPADRLMFEPGGKLLIEIIPVNQGNAIAPIIEQVLHITVLLVNIASLVVVDHALFERLLAGSIQAAIHILADQVVEMLGIGFHLFHLANRESLEEFSKRLFQLFTCRENM